MTSTRMQKSPRGRFFHIQKPFVDGLHEFNNALLLLQDMSAGEQFTVLTDRSEGGASIHDGEVELMVHLTF